MAVVALGVLFSNLMWSHKKQDDWIARTETREHHSKLKSVKPAEALSEIKSM